MGMTRAVKPIVNNWYFFRHSIVFLTVSNCCLDFKSKYMRPSSVSDSKYNAPLNHTIRHSVLLNSQPKNAKSEKCDIIPPTYQSLLKTQH